MALEYDNDEFEISEEFSADPYSEEPLLPKKRKWHKKNRKTEIEEEYDVSDF